MRLEADPTVAYAYGRRLRRVWEKNLAIRSPYNTYQRAGLPPGPIGQPGRASLLAALYPAGVPFQYFVARRRSEEHTSELQSLRHLVCRLLLEKKKNTKKKTIDNH